ncbi:UDP-N-acetylglucosamine 2-epimerase (hydrolysing) [Yoonia litorea]|uniref:UDP-N-acetylglucosamine 2-epimerase (Hydrolysing) n=1 Tax=Yoonia litorea TaxID=1123755 RepID=A0A1I6MWK6_9RHOB|nr:UDP-N-acetylglucosamine 2-epimerase (hydrolysing) [Yoonia litorea]
MSKSLLFVTGTRADYGKLEPLARAAKDAGFAVSFFVTGMHMMDRYGMTKLEVLRFGAPVHEFLNQREGDPQDIVLAKTVVGFSDYIAEAQPDLVIVHGDRVEALACALVCATNYIRCAHVEGGEVSGTIDEVFRHCNSKLSYAHFVSSEDAATRLRALGEDAGSIHVIGSPELDFHARSSGVPLSEVKSRYDIPFEDFGIVIFHPVTSEASDMGRQAEMLFGALQSSGKHFVTILPNNDPGSEAILHVIEGLPASHFRVIPSMRFAHFSELMRNAACIVGNSSMGVREAPFLGVPSLDVGTRQTKRGKSPSITSVLASDRQTIEAFIESEWLKRYERDAGFGKGDAAQGFVSVLREPSFWQGGMQKTFQDA